MKTYIFLKELQIHLQNRSILITWGVIIVMYVLNASVHVFQCRDLYREYENNVAASHQSLIYDENQKPNTLPSMVYLRQKIYNPPSSLSFISGTAADIVPDGASMQMLEEPDFETFAQDNPHRNPWLSIDWTTLMIYIISFLCICFSYNAFSGEREDGTLKLMLANSLPRSSIIFGKYFGLLVVFLIPILAGVLISCLIFEISPAIRLEWVDYVKIGWYFFVSVLTVSLTILLGFFISSLTKNSYVSLIICLLCWTLLAVIIPNISWIISSRSNKIPALTDIYREEKQQQDALKDCYMGWKGNSSTVETAIDRKDCIDRRTAIHNNLWSDYHNRQMEQTTQAIELSCISPFGLFRFLGDKISGNNFYGYAHFFKQVKDYQLTFRNYITDKDNADPESSHIFWNEWQGFYEGFMSRQSIIPEEVPQITVHPRTFRELATDTVGGIAILCFWSIGLFGLLFVSFVKYDVR